MFGPAKPRRLSEPIAVSLEGLVPASSFYRHLEAKLDLSFVREWSRDLSAERGRPSIDPVVFFTLQPVMFTEGLRSERQLIETARSPRPGSLRSLPHPPAANPLGSRWDGGGEDTVTIAPSSAGP